MRHFVPGLNCPDLYQSCKNSTTLVFGKPRYGTLKPAFVISTKRMLALGGEYKAFFWYDWWPEDITRMVFCSWSKLSRVYISPAKIALMLVGGLSCVILKPALKVSSCRTRRQQILPTFYRLKEKSVVQNIFAVTIVKK